MIQSGIQAVLVKVAAMGLRPERHLGQTLAEMQEQLCELSDSYGCNVCGEGGEYETLVLDCPLFNHGAIRIDQSGVLSEQSGDIAPSGVLDIQSFHIVPKGDSGPALLLGCVQHVPESFDASAPLAAPLPPPAVSDVVKISVTETGHWLGFKATGAGFNSLETCLEAVLSSLKDALLQRGLTLSNAAFVHLFLRDMKDFAVANRVYSQHFPPVSPPSRACVQLNLTSPCVLQVLACNRSDVRSVLHVQSMSEWAPCCIGPYSQATSLKQLTLMAGQLGLDPVCMSLEGRDWKEEVSMALKHCQSIAVAVGADSRKATVKATVYLSEAFAVQLSGADRDVLKSMFEEHWLALKQSSDDSLATGLEDCEEQDTYLRPPGYDFEIHPLACYVVVPALPKNARIEIQPILLNSKSPMHHTVEASAVEPLCSVSVQRPVCKIRQEWNSSWLNAPIALTVLELKSWKPGMRPSAVVLRQPHAFCLIQISCPAATGAGFTVEHLGNLLVDVIEECLLESGTAAREITSAMLWYNADRLSESDLSELQSRLEAWQDDVANGWCWLPSKGVGTDLSLSDFLLLDLTIVEIS